MLVRRPMAALTLNSGRHFLQRQLPALGSIRRVAAKAEQSIVTAHQAAGGIEQGGRRRTHCPEGDAEPFRLAEIADSAFIELAVLLENISLADGRTCANRPPNRQGEGLES